MPLSINKLVKVLGAKNFIPKNFFSLDGTCAFVEIVSLKNADTYMLYIPSKYEFDTNQYRNNLKLKQINISDDDRADIDIPNDIIRKIAVTHRLIKSEDF